MINSPNALNKVSIRIVFAFVAVTLYQSAKQTHGWYLKKFDDYPKTRRALIPFLI